jgi:hypothetical protein
VGVFFLFATDLAMEMGFTDDWYTDGRVPSVIMLPKEFIIFTDRISPSVKLVNGVVHVQESCLGMEIYKKIFSKPIPDFYF